MTPYRSMLIAKNGESLSYMDTNEGFICEEICWTTDKKTDRRLYQQILFNVLTNPKQLNYHIQRIHLTYKLRMAEPLYAALVDLLLVLDGKGKELSKSMILSTRSLLEKRQFGLLVNVLKHQNTSLLTGNKFSVFTKGLVGSCELLTKTVQTNHTVAHDPLVIALDYIEYSQLDHAIETLQTGILEFPDRQDLQNELLELYKLTKNKKAFVKMRDLLIETEFQLSSEWQELTAYFSGLTNE